MSKQEKKALVPELRFPEFRDAGRWEDNTFGGAATFINGKAYKQEELLDKGKYRVLRVGNFFSNKEWYYSDLELDENKYCDNGDLLYAWSASFGPRIWKYEKVIYHYHIWKVVESEGIDRDFLFILLGYETERMKAQSANGLGLLHITKGAIEGWKCSIPKPKEQRKIAECLTSIDELFTAQTQKLDALKAHKKGLMQQLFPAEGETIPKLRFPEFRDAAEWKEEVFGKILKVNSGKGFKASEYSNNGIRLLQIENVGYGVTKWNENTNYLPDNYDIEYPELVLRKGDIVLALNRPVTNNELKIARIKKEDEPLILYQRVGKLELLDDTLKVDFVFHICQQFIKDFVINKSIGSDQPFISLRDLYAQDILIPTPKEQQKIADCLSSIEELIAAQAQNIEALKDHKKGLMQQLFPATDEVSA